MKKKFNWCQAALLGALWASVALLAGCGGGGGSSTSSGSPSAEVKASAWEAQPGLPGACCNYSSLVFEEQGRVRIYSNSSSGKSNGALNLYEGTLDGVGLSRVALLIVQPSDAYIRTSAITRYAGRYYALLYTGDAYPPSAGYAPSWAESDDGVAFRWMGPISPYPRGFSSGQALTVDAHGVFRAWIDDVGGTLREMSSADGLRWVDEGDMWPVSLPAKQAVFPAAAKSTHGVMLSVADAYPSTKIRILWKCDGQKNWTVLEEDSVVHQSVKGTALAWDGERFHAYGNGMRWTRSEPACAAP